MNWGKGLAVAMASFAALMAWFIVKAQQNPEPLVTEQYYEQELKYQDRIDATERASSLGNVQIEADHNTCRIAFPDGVLGKKISGELLLQRPNDPSADRVVPITVVVDGASTIAVEGLKVGRYNAQLSWKADGIAYFTEEKLVVP